MKYDKSWEELCNDNRPGMQYLKIRSRSEAGWNSKNVFIDFPIIDERSYHEETIDKDEYEKRHALYKVGQDKLEDYLKLKNLRK